jgi:hypothetical protein
VATTGSDDARRRDEGAMGMSAGLAQMGEATVGEAMMVDAGQDWGRAQSSMNRRRQRPRWEGGGKMKRVKRQASEVKKERRGAETRPKRVLCWMAAPMPSSSASTW